jgi:AcrR family transcriptional regulator
MATRPSPPQRAREREAELVRVTRALFDERGMQDAPVEEIARAVGIARGLIYRHFSSKEELFVLTVTDYLDELGREQDAAVSGEISPVVRLERLAETYASFAVRYPAFIDSSLSLMRRPASELQATISDSVWLRLGQGMARCIGHLARVLREGAEDGTFPDVEDPDFTANTMWTKMLGAMNLARIGVGVRELAPGVPGLFEVTPEQVVRTCVDDALVAAGAARTRA